MAHDELPAIGRRAFLGGSVALVALVMGMTGISPAFARVTGRWSNPMIGNTGAPAQLYNAPRENGRLHKGFDIGTDGVRNRPVVAASDGYALVTQRDIQPERGRWVLLQHADNIRTLYQHLDSITAGLVAGKSIVVGEQIGICGDTGGDYAIHLHIEVLDKGSGTYVDSNTQTTDPDRFFRDLDIILGHTPPTTSPPIVAPPQEDTVARLMKHPDGTVALIGPGPQMVILYTVDQMNAMWATSQAVGDLIVLPNPLIWNLCRSIAERAGTYAA